MEILKQWDIEATSITELQEKVWDINHSYILKAYDNPDECMKNIYIYDTLRQHGIPIPEVIRTVQGESFGKQDKLLYILSRRLSGNHLSAEDVINSPAIASNIGRMTGRLHKAFSEITGQIHSVDNNFVEELKGWIKRSLQEHAKDSFTYTIFEDCLAELDAVYDKLERHLIHRDLHLGNLLLVDNEITGYIDFDLSQINAKIFDIAYLCADWAVNKISNEEYMAAWKQAVQAIVSGYHKEHSLSNLEKQSIGIMMCCIEMLFVAYFYGMNDSVNATSSEDCLRWLWNNRNDIVIME